MDDATDDLICAFENHLTFMAKHRGVLRPREGGRELVGAAPALSFWTPDKDALATPADCGAVRAPPWASARQIAAWSAAGFAASETLAYMALAAPSRALSDDGAFEVVRVATEEGARQFAAAQAGGFATGDPATDDWWGPFFETVALRNFRDPAQTFYLTLDGGAPVGTTLALDAAGVVGIYAVATVPSHRRRGVSAAALELVRRAALEARNPVILQAMKGSYAEGYYARLGFRTLAELSVWRRG